MKRLIILIALVSLTGCNSIRQAKADKIRSATRHTNELHSQQIVDEAALFEDRIATKATVMWSLTICSIILLLSGSLAGSYAFIGYSIVWVRQQAKRANIQTIPLNPVTRQFDLIIYRGNRAYEPNTGQRVLLDQNTGPIPMLVAGTYQVRNSQKVIEGR